MILSLPDSGLMIEIKCHLLKVSIFYMRKVARIWRPEYISPNGEHYWEVNSARKYTEKKIRKKLSEQFKVEREYFLEKNPYHRFYICSPINDGCE